MATTGIVGSALSFSGGAKLTYCLESSPACVDPVASLVNNELLVRLPESTVQDWASTEKVGISTEQGLDDGGYLKILIEKDFACLVERDGEDDSDMYPHPEDQQASC